MNTGHHRRYPEVVKQQCAEVDGGDLDGRSSHRPVFEAKFMLLVVTGGSRRREYMPQLQHNMSMVASN